MAEFERRSQALGFVREPTNIDRSRSMRTVDMKVLCLGLGRTGTSSIRTALIMLGYFDVYHMTSCANENKPDMKLWHQAILAKYEGKGKLWGRSEFDRVLGHCQAVCDAPTAHFAPELIEAYPEAQIMISVRDSPEAWKKSVLETFWPIYKLISPPTGFWERIYKGFLWLIRPSLEGSDFFTSMMTHSLTPDFEEYGEQLYTLHNDEVKAAARSRGRDVLEFNVKQGWGPLCEFLNVPVPKDKDGNELPFPRINDSKSSRLDSEEMLYTEMSHYFWSKGIYRLAGYIAIGSALYMGAKNRTAVLGVLKSWV